jgi:hypothetical protein
MYSVDIYNRVRRACLKDGMSAREAARYFNKDRKTIAKMLRHALPPGYRRSEAPRRPTLDDYVGVTGISEQSDEAPEFTAQFQEGIEADIRWLTDLVPTQFMFRASVQNNDNWEEIETIDAAVLLRSRPDMSEKSVLRSKRMKLRTSVKTRSAEHSKAMTLEFQAYRKSVLQKLPTTWAQRYKVMKNEAGNKALVYDNRADRRALVTGPEAMATANIGRVNADRRRAKQTKALFEARADTTSKSIASIAGEKQLFEMHVCLRFIKIDDI